MTLGIPIFLLLLLRGWESHTGVEAGLEHTCFLLDRNPTRNGLCNSNMIDRTLRAVCGVGYRTNKRNHQAVEDEATSSMMDIATTRRSALSYLVHKRTSTQGFTCECCYNMCGYGELMEYCE